MQEYWVNVYDLGVHGQYISGFKFPERPTQLKIVHGIKVLYRIHVKMKPQVYIQSVGRIDRRERSIFDKLNWMD